MDGSHVKKMTVIFRMLSNSNRLQILFFYLEKATSVSELVDRLKLSQSLVSHHLKQLRDANLIQATRQGKNMLYQVIDKRVQCILKDTRSYTNAVTKKRQKK